MCVDTQNSGFDAAMTYLLIPFAMVVALFLLARLLGVSFGKAQPSPILLSTEMTIAWLAYPFLIGGFTLYWCSKVSHLTTPLGTFLGGVFILGIGSWIAGPIFALFVRLSKTVRQAVVITFPGSIFLTGFFANWFVLSTAIHFCNEGS